MKKYALVDLRGNAPLGAEIEVISTSPDGVCIVEWYGNRFSCRAEQLGDTKPFKEENNIGELSLF